MTMKEAAKLLKIKEYFQQKVNWKKLESKISLLELFGRDMTTGFGMGHMMILKNKWIEILIL